MFGPQDALRSPARVLLMTVLIAACSGSAATTVTPTNAPASAASTPAATPQPSSTASSAPGAAATVAPTPVPSDGSAAGQVRTDAFGIEQVWVPAGTFTMGTDKAAIARLKAAGPPGWVAPALDAEAPAHKV